MTVARFAPSPTGRLHLGHAYSAVLGHRSARERGGKFLLRIEDLDQTRSRPEFVNDIFEDLRWLGLDWAEPLLVQSARSAAYAAALDELRRIGVIYACFCTRADIAAATSAPHGDVGLHYPGICRHRLDNPQRRAGQLHSWRLDAAKAIALAGLSTWREGARTFRTSAEQIGDVILARKDAPAAYHLACVIDDAATGVNLVVRGEDLRPSTPIQRLLQTLLGLPEPEYLHHPLILRADGRRLAKRDHAPTLAALRETGFDGPQLAKDLATGKLPGDFRFGSA